MHNGDRRWLGMGASLGLAFVLLACQRTADGQLGGAGGVGANQGFSPPASNKGMTMTGTPAPAAAQPAGGAGTSNAGAPAKTGNGGSSSAPQASAGSGAAGMMASSAGAGGTTEDVGAGGAAGMMAMGHGDLGKGDGSDVITIGDSWMSIITNGGGIEGGLDRAGTMYRHYAVAGTTLIGGDIPQQYIRAKQVNPKISTVIMTGGGNDIMFSNGCATKESCTMAVQQIVDALDQLWGQMADDGVKDTIFISYSKNAGTAPSDTRPDTAPIPKICTSGRITCHSLDTTPMVGPGDTVDGIHPTFAACDAIAKGVLDLMVAGGVRR